jgi:hypothetical protein
MQELREDFWEYSKLPEPYRAIEKGDLRAALDAFATREMLDYRLHGPSHSDVWVCGFGLTLWLMGDPRGAGKVWSRACDEAMRGKFKYSSTGTFQSGLLLWFASVWLKEEDWHEQAGALFDKLLKKKRPVLGADFSILLASLLRREIDLPEVRASYRDQPTHTHVGYEWRALFYAGVRACENGELEETRRLWRQAKERTDTSVAMEYYLLEHERKKLDGLGQSCAGNQ